MLKLLTVLATGFFILSAATALGQTNIRQKKIRTDQDTIQLDTLSLVPGSVILKDPSGVGLPSSAYQILYDKALLIWKQKQAFAEVDISYRIFPVLFSRKYFNKDPSLIGEKTIDNSGYVYKGKREENTLFTMAGLTKSGSISRSVGLGNNQDLIVNSNMNLQLSGKLKNDVEILAAIADDNIPVQAAGNTQPLNEFDKVFIQLKRRNTQLTAGDYELRRPDSYFMNFFKRAQGGSFSTASQHKSWSYKGGLAVAVAKGRSARNVFQGAEGNQGPYRLTGNNAEQFIIVLSGTERVYLDGELLLRGQENDYVMDYNTSEITFTPKRLITQNSRINIEFEYSDRNYARSLTYFNQEVSNQKLAFRFNFYNEQDNPNRPFLQDLNSSQKEFLQTIGNQTSQAYFSNVDSVPFNENEVLYKKIDTLGASGVYVYSANEQDARYRIGFSFVGQGQGNYRINTQSPVNGRVFEFVSPMGGVRQGSYEPVTLLATPKKQQLITLATDYKLNKSTIVSAETAFSNNDPNLFSRLGNNENSGFAMKVFGHNEYSFGKKDSSSLKLISSASLEIASTNFKAIERYRPVEFERDFNLYGLTSAAKENLGKISLTLFKDQFRQLNYQFISFVRQGLYTGIQHSVEGNYLAGKYKVNYAGNLLNSSSEINTGNFYRQRAGLSRQFKELQFRLGFEQEHNQTRGLQNTALTLNSFSFSQYKVRLASNSGAANRFRLEYSRRYDKLPNGDELQQSSVADVIEGGIELNKNPNSVLNISSTYRILNYAHRIAAQNENTFLGRAAYNLITLKGSLNSSSFYEFGTGQEPKHDFTYLEVQAGQGAYTWNDYNSNNIKELNEFEIARYQDQAEFIRISQPTNQYIKTNYTAISQTVKLSPASLLDPKSEAKNFVGKFTDQVELKVDRKILDQGGLSVFNPFNTRIEAASLVSLNSYFRNTLFFDRNNPVFTFDINYQGSGSKTLLTNGFDTRGRKQGGIRFRWNLVQKASLTLQANEGRKLYESELFTTQNYHIRFAELSPQFDYLLNTNFRLSFIAGLTNQRNLILEKEKVANVRLSAESRYNIVNKGVITSGVNMIRNRYSGQPNSPAAYELLEGLQPGNNLVWDLGLQRSVANGIQMNVNYQGRKSPGVQTIHTGGVQVRAFF
ncbi:MAG: hypothetical protein K0S09_1740 [Sphingobacteriaceae bacterium]|jgi:hypothetical protein|nr:hypothetical protein [Sphingobacteriaceae bacterium]